MKKKDYGEAGVRFATWVKSDLAEWIKNEASKRKWSKSFFVAETLREAMDREGRETGVE